MPHKWIFLREGYVKLIDTGEVINGYFLTTDSWHKTTCMFTDKKFTMISYRDTPKDGQYCRPLVVRPDLGDADGLPLVRQCVQDHFSRIILD